MVELLAEPSEVLAASAGTLSDVPLPVLVHAVYACRRTCVVELRRLATEKRLIFEDGAPVACTSNLVHETLGQHLVEKGLLTEERSRKLLADAARTGRKLGEVLLEAGVLDEAELHKQLQANVGRRALDSFRWVAASYRLVGFADVAEPALKMHALQLIYTGVCTTLPIETVRQGLRASEGQRFARVPRPPHHLGSLRLKELDQRLIELLVTPATAAELQHATGLAEEDVARRLYAWVLMRFADFAERVPREPAHSTEAAPAPGADAPPTRPKPPAADAAAAHDEALPNMRPIGLKVGVAVAAVVALGGAVLWVSQGARPTPPASHAAVIPVEERRPAVDEPVPTPASQPPLPQPPALPDPAGGELVVERTRALSASGIELDLPQQSVRDALAKAWFEKGLRALHAGDAEKSADAFARSTLVAPNDAECWYGVALASYLSGKDTEARAAIDKVLVIEPNHAMGNLLGGYLAQLAGDFDAARARYQVYLSHARATHATEVRELVEQLERNAP